MIKREIFVIFLVAVFMFSLVSADSSQPINVTIVIDNDVTPSPSEPSGGSGGGDGGFGFPLEISPDSLELSVYTDEENISYLTLENKLYKKIKIEVLASGEIGNYTGFNEIVELDSKEKKLFEVKIEDLNRSLVGELIFKYKSLEKKIPVTIDVKNRGFLLDVYSRLNKKTLIEGQNISSVIELNQISETSENLGVDIKYFIKDLEGNILLEDSDTFNFSDIKVYEKQFSTSDFEPGKYVFVMEVDYEENLASSSSQFNISKKSLIRGFFEEYKMYILGVLFLLLLTFLVIILKRKIHKEEEPSFFYYKIFRVFPDFHDEF